MNCVTLPFARNYKNYTFYVEKLKSCIDETMPMWRDHWNEQKEEELRGQEFNPALQLFYDLEERKLFTYITVRDENDVIVGHFGLSYGINKQTSKQVSGDEVFYIKPEYRKGGLGMALIKFAKELAFSCGSEEFSLSYRVSVADLDPVMRRCGLHKIANVYTVRRP